MISRERVIQIPVSRLFKAAPRKCKRAYISLGLHLNSNSSVRFKHTHRPGFWLGFIDFFTAGLFFLLYMPLGGLQDELDEILGVFSGSF